MRRGALRNAKFRSTHEAAGGYEPVAAVGQPACRCRRRGDSLVHGRILAATQGEKPSVVQIRADDVSPDVIGPQVLAALQQMAAELQEGALVTIDTNRTRIRVLPLQTRH